MSSLHGALSSHSGPLSLGWGLRLENVPTARARGAPVALLLAGQPGSQMAGPPPLAPAVVWPHGLAGTAFISCWSLGENEAVHVQVSTPHVPHSCGWAAPSLRKGIPGSWVRERLSRISV